MSDLVRPVSCRLVRPEWAERVVSPAYDAVSGAQRDELMAREPHVFLHVTRTPRSDTPEVVAAALEESAAAFERLVNADVFGPEHPPAYYLYRLETADHTQTALVGDVSLAAHDAGRILPHEQVRPRRAEHLAAHLARLQMNSSPVAFAYRHDDDLSSAMSHSTHAAPPVLDFERGDGLRQTLWRVQDPGFAALVAERLGDQRLYIVDGHHRVAAALAHRALRHDEGHTDPQAPHEFVLGALFAQTDLRVAAFHRRVAGPLPAPAAELVAGLAAGGSVEPADGPPELDPAGPVAVGLYLDRRWYRYQPGGVPAGALDVDVVHERVLPVLGAHDGAVDEHLEYLPDVAGLEHLVERCDADGGAAVVMRPLRLDQLMAVVDRGELLPPKSTYFTPKVRSGVFCCGR